MIERGRRAGFLLEPAKPIGIGAERRRQHLDRDIAAQASIVRSIHFAHAAAANQAGHFVVADPSAGSD